MADYIKFDISNGRIIKKYVSVDGSDIKDDADVLKVDRTTLESITKFHKVDNRQVVLMTQAEKDTFIQEEKDTADNEERVRIDKLEVAVKDVIVALIKRINIRIPSNPITKQEVINQIKNDKNL